MDCMKTHWEFYVNLCNRFFLVGEDSFGTRRLTHFCNSLGRNTKTEKKFKHIWDYTCTPYSKHKDEKIWMQCSESLLCLQRHKVLVRKIMIKSVYIDDKFLLGFWTR